MALVVSPLFLPQANRPLALAVGAALLVMANPLAAQQMLSESIVTATGISTASDALATTVSSVGRDELDRRLPSDEADIFRDEPDVSLARDLRRHGATRVNIRGIEDNRVVQMLDGVRLGDYYNGGGPTNYTMSSTLGSMPDFLKRVEIVRGAASSLYGSDAMGGVVGYMSLEPSDLLQKDVKTAARLRLSYAGANQGKMQTAMAAVRGESTEFLLGYSQNRADEFENQGTNGSTSASRSQPNRLQVKDQGLLAKLVWQPSQGHRLKAILEGRDQSASSEILRLSGALPRMTWVTGDDQAQRQRFSVEWEHVSNAAFYDRLTARVYQQDSETRNRNNQRRTGTSASCSAVAVGANQCYIEGDFSLDQNSTGANVQFESAWKQGSVQHLLSYGADLGRVKVEQKRDARIWNQTTNTFTKTLAGETFPLRDFAIGQTQTLGVFIQDEIEGLADGRLSLMPGLRYDRTRLRPEVDALAAQVLTQNNRQVAEQSHGSFSPKLGVTWKFNQQVSGYGQLARGFRAPNYQEVNGNFRNTAQQYGITPNAALKPETSTGLELGLRLKQESLRGQLSVFDNRYKDFIESLRYDNCHLPGANPNCIAGTRTTFQSVNFSRVNIRGAELRVQWNPAPGWQLGSTFAYARGHNEQSDQPLNSVEPRRLNVNVTRDFGAWGLEGRVHAAGSKSRIDDTGGAFFRTPGYAVSDVSAWWRINPRTQLVATVNNLFDRKYWLWSDIRQADAPNPLAVDFYSQPGRHANLAIQMDF